MYLAGVEMYKFGISGKTEWCGGDIVIRDCSWTLVLTDITPFIYPIVSIDSKMEIAFKNCIQHTCLFYNI